MFLSFFYFSNFDDLVKYFIKYIDVAVNASLHWKKKRKFAWQIFNLEFYFPEALVSQNLGFKNKLFIF